MDKAQFMRLKELAQEAPPGPWATCLNAIEIFGRPHPDWGCVYATIEHDGITIEGCHLLRVNSNLMTDVEEREARKEYYNTGNQVNPGLMGKVAEYIAAANPTAILELVADYERLQKEYVELQDISSDPEILNDPQALTTCYFAGRMAEGREKNREMDKLLEENEQLKKEADWLAKNGKGEDQCPYLAFYRHLSGNARPKWCNCLDNGEEFDCDEYAPDCWRKAAHEAVEKENEAHKGTN